jgi:signal transduction histidine kinase
MTPVIGQVQRLRRQARAGATSVKELESGLERLEWLIDRYVRRATVLLDVSRLRAGKLALRPVPTDLREVLRAVVRASEPVAQHLGAAVSVEAPEALPGIWDPLALEQVIDNLVTNAIKYGDGKPVTVTAVGDGATATLTVRDRGIGISPEDQSRIFGKFERVAEDAGRTGGFGVGLWLVKQLVEAMGGFISVTSNRGEGSAFTVRLPVQMALEPGGGGT